MCSTKRKSIKMALNITKPSNTIVMIKRNMETEAKFCSTLLEKLRPPIKANTTAEKILRIEIDCS